MNNFFINWASHYEFSLSHIPDLSTVYIINNHTMELLVNVHTKYCVRSYYNYYMVFYEIIIKSWKNTVRSIFLISIVTDYFCIKAKQRERKKEKSIFMVFAQCAAVTNLLFVLFSRLVFCLSLSLSLFSIWIFLGLFTCASTDTLLFLILLFHHLEQQSISSPSCLLFMSSMSKPPPIISLWVLLYSGLLSTHLPAHPSACQTTHLPGGFLRIDSEFRGKETQSSTARVPATCGAKGWYRLIFHGQS